MRVSTRGLSHHFPGAPALFPPLDLDLVAGQLVAVCGPSGCGKSTLLSLLAGWVTPASGRVERDGVRRIGWVFQSPHGVSGRTAIDHVVLPLLAAGHRRVAAESRALGLLALFGLDQVAGRPFRALSGGEAQRLMLARAVATGPDLLLVDEPTAQLDLATARSVSGTLVHLAQAGSVVVVATHDPGARRACSHVVDLAEQAPRLVEQPVPAVAGPSSPGVEGQE